jgi:translocation and assembly module TamB
LATGLRLAQRYAIPASQQLAFEGASGSLRKGGHIDQLSWQQEGLSATAKDITLAWQPWSLLKGALKFERLTIATLEVKDQRPPTPQGGPPEQLRLPLQIGLDEFSLGLLRYTGPASSAAIEVSSLTGRYGYDGVQHQVDLRGVEALGGRYDARAYLSASSPLMLDMNLSGALAVDLPARTTTTAALPLTFQAVIKGPLTALAVNAQLQTGAVTSAPAATSAATSASTPAGTPAVAGSAASGHGQATLTAVINPWAVQPLPQADASFSQLNLLGLFAQAPQTLLTGAASIRPLTSTVATGTTTTSLASQAWVLQTSLANSLPGPWDQQRLPLDELDAVVEWRKGTAVIRSLKALTGGGQLNATGQWAGPVASGPTGNTATAPAAAPGWTLQATLDNINPARLHSQLAPLPVGGKASASSQGDSINFDAALKAATKAGRPGPRSKLLGQLQLQDASAKGQFNPKLAGGTVVLQALRLRTDDAELAGRLELGLSPLAGQGQLNFTAPGLDASAKGALRKNSGGGELNLRVKNASQALAWVKKLPGLPAALQTQLAAATASGNGLLAASWQGGWADPALQVKLTVPSLDLQLAGKTNTAAAPTVPTSTSTSTSTATSSTTVTANSTAPAASPTLASGDYRLRDLQASVSGRLSQAKVTAQGRLEAGDRRVRLQLAADAGRASPATDANPLAGSWQAVVKQFDASLQDPALSAGAWSLGLSRPLSLRWTPPPATASRKDSPAAGVGTFESSAGEAVLRAPTAQPSNARIAWQPVRFRNGELSTAGKVTGLPMAWLELFAGPQLAGAGLGGNLVFDGEWDARLADGINVKASLARSSGDITVLTDTAEGRNERVAAGVRQARLTLTNEGDALNLALVWDSERAGSAEAQLKTRLTRIAANSEGAGGWTWAADAPLAGQLRAQLPRIAVWSVLAPPGWRIRGSIATNLSISGSRANPQLAGELLGDGMALRSVVDGIEFGNGRLRATFDGTRMRISEFSLQGAGQSGAAGKVAGSGGTLIAQGEAAWVGGQPSVQLNAKLDQLRASLRTDRQITLSGNLQASLQGKAVKVTGALTVDQARIQLPEEGTPQLGDDVVVRAPGGGTGGKKGPEKALAAAAPAPPQTGLKVDVAVKIDLGNDFRVQGKGIDTRLRGSLVLTADSLSNPRLSGEIRTVGGQYRAYGQRLDIERGVIRFNGPIDNPRLDILAIRPNLSQRVGVQILGTALLPRVTLYAEPDLPDAEKLSWLVLGRSSASGGAEAALLQQAALALLGSRGGTGSGGLAGALGLDELSYGASSATGATGQSAITLGKRFTDNFYAAYERSIAGAVGTLFIFYDLSRRFTVRAELGPQSAVDLIFTVTYD